MNRRLFGRLLAGIGGMFAGIKASKASPIASTPETEFTRYAGAGIYIGKAHVMYHEGYWSKFHEDEKQVKFRWNPLGWYINPSDREINWWYYYAGWKWDTDNQRWLVYEKIPTGKVLKKGDCIHARWVEGDVVRRACFHCHGDGIDDLEVLSYSESVLFDEQLDKADEHHIICEGCGK